MGLSNEAEGAQVSKADSSQDDVTELAAGRLDHRGVPKPSVIKYPWRVSNSIAALTHSSFYEL